MSEERKGWFARLKSGLARSSSKLSEGIGGIFARRRLDDAALGELEELLIAADMGIGHRRGSDASACAARASIRKWHPTRSARALAEEVAKSAVELVDRPLRLDPALKPYRGSRRRRQRQRQDDDDRQARQAISRCRQERHDGGRRHLPRRRRSSSSRSGASAPAAGDGARDRRRCRRPRLRRLRRGEAPRAPTCC